MIRYLKLYFYLFKFSCIQYLEHRIDFLTNTLRSLGWIGVALISFAILFQQSNTIAGWNRNELLLMFGMYMLINESWYALFSENLVNFSELIRLGDFDHILLLPVSTQFISSLQNFLVFSLPNIFFSLCLVGYNLHFITRHITGVQYVISGLLVLNG